MSSVRSLSWVEQLELRARDLGEDVADAAGLWLAENGVDEVDGVEELDSAPAGADEAVLPLRLLLVRATVDIGRGRLERGASTIRRVRQWAVQHDERYLQARCEYVLGLLLRRAGEVTTALEHAVASVDLLPDDAHPAVRADLILGLADALSMCRSEEDAVVRYGEAQQLADLAQDVRMRLLVRNNLAYTFYEFGSYDHAVALCEEILSIAAANGVELPLHALDTLAVTYVAVGDLAAAERALARVAVVDSTAPDDAAESLLTLASVRRGRGDLAGAKEALGRARALTERHDLGGVAVRVMLEQAELSAAERQFERALGEFREYHERLLARHAVEREARARMLQAIFEASEARRESQRFREMSYRDPLTQLRNRRYVDEQLSLAIEASFDRGRPISVAFIDLDHFKQVNDTCSHEVGDEVLRRVAAVLDRYGAARPDAVAARMGGEEFLLVLPGADREQTARLLDELRADVEGIDWQGVTRGVPVTVSIGAATAPADGTDRLQLLGTADRRLYVAKDGGRNRVVDVG